MFFKFVEFAEFKYIGDSYKMETGLTHINLSPCKDSLLFLKN